MSSTPLSTPSPDPARGRAERRDRHGRHRRTVVDPRRRPSEGYRVGSTARFVRLVTEATGRLPDAIRTELEAGTLGVVDVPPAGDVVTLGEVDGAPGHLRVVLHQRAIESRANSKADLLDLLATAVVELVADHRGWDDDDLDTMGWSPDT